MPMDCMQNGLHKRGAWARLLAAKAARLKHKGKAKAGGSYGTKGGINKKASLASGRDRACGATGRNRVRFVHRGSEHQRGGNIGSRYAERHTGSRCLDSAGSIDI